MQLLQYARMFYEREEERSTCLPPGHTMSDCLLRYPSAGGLHFDGFDAINLESIEGSEFGNDGNAMIMAWMRSITASTTTISTQCIQS